MFAIVFSEIIGVFGDLEESEEQKRKITLYSLLFVAIGAANFISNTLQVNMEILHCIDPGLKDSTSKTLSRKSF